MRILVAYPYLPYPLTSGTYQRTYNLLKQLAGRHSVDLFALHEDPSAADYLPFFSGFCRRVGLAQLRLPAWPKFFPYRLFSWQPVTFSRWFDLGVAENLARFMRNESYDLVYVCDIVMAQYFWNCGIPVVVDRSRVDISFQMDQSRRFAKSWKSRFLDWENIVKLWFVERRVGRFAAMEVVGGQDDAEFLQRLLGAGVQTCVVPNGVDVAHFSRAAVPAVARDSRPTVMFCGALDYSANTDGLRWYFSEIHPLLSGLVPGLQVLVVGRSPTPEVVAYGALPGVTVVGSVPDVRPYYQRAWLQIVPLRIGGGSRLKIPESLAMETPVVSTTVGAQGLGLRDGQEVLLADSPAAFAAATARALGEPWLLSFLSVAGRSAVCARLGWPVLARQLDAALCRLSEV